VLELLFEQHERVINEHIVSGPGLEFVFTALNKLHGKSDRHLPAAEIFALATQGSDAVAAEAVQLFFEVLGQISGDLALEWGTGDGVFIAGGIVPRYRELLERSDFRAAFERKGCYRSLLEQVPTLLITHPDPGLLGAASRALAAYKDWPGDTP
jgi:glucokinase